MSHSQTPPSNTLLERSPSAADGAAAVADVLSRPAESDLLVVSYRDSPDEWVQNWRASVGDLPAEVGFVNVGVTTRSAASAASPADSTVRSPSVEDGLPVSTAVSDPTDLGRVGVRASEYLDAWADDGRRSVVVLDSVTAMLDEVAVERVFHFLHVLAGRVESVDGRGYYLLDRSAHDDRELSMVRELPDAVVELDAPHDG